MSELRKYGQNEIKVIWGKKHFRGIIKPNIKPKVKPKMAKNEAQNGQKTVAAGGPDKLFSSDYNVLNDQELIW